MNYTVSDNHDWKSIVVPLSIIWGQSSTPKHFLETVQRSTRSEPFTISNGTSSNVSFEMVENKVACRFALDKKDFNEANIHEFTKVAQDAFQNRMNQLYNLAESLDLLNNMLPKKPDNETATAIKGLSLAIDQGNINLANLASRVDYLEQNTPAPGMIATPAPSPQSHCENCGWRGRPRIQLAEIPNLLERITVGGVVPSGECPKCTSLCYSE